MIIRFICSLWFAALFVISMAHVGRAMTLEESISAALEYNPTLSAARDNYRAVERSRFVSLATMLPRASAFYESVDTRRRQHAPVSGQTPLTEYTVDSYGISATQTLFASGRYYNAYRGTVVQIKGEAHSLHATEQQILLAAITAHVDVLRDQAVLGLQQKNVDVLNAQLDATRDRFEVGVVTRTDVAQAEARQAQARSGLLGAQTELRGSEAVYHEIIGMPPHQLETPQTIPAIPTTLDDAQAIARKENPALNMARATARQGQLRTFSAIGEALPSVELTASYRRNDNDTSNPVTPNPKSEETRLGVRLNVPLLMGGRAVAGIQAARAAESALAKGIHIASTATERGVIVAWHQHLVTLSVIEARREQIRAAEIALESTIQENKLGTRNTLDVLDAEQELFDARVELARAERDSYVARYGVLASIGRLTYDYLSINSKFLPPAQETAE